MKIIIATGGSGGHIFPALSLADELKKEAEIVFVCDRGKSQDTISNRGYEAIPLSVVKPSLKNIFPFSWRLIKSYGESAEIINTRQPHAVVGFGSYASFTTVLAASAKKIPTIIHEQNVVPGQANRVLSVFADRIATSFAESARYLPKQKIILTGCPIRRELLNAYREEAFKKLGLSRDKFTILVLGGSQGSHNINVNTTEALKGLPDKNRLQVIHITGEADCDLLKSRYQKIGIEHCVFAFLPEMGYAYRLADLIISRAGASTIAEIALFSIPAILVPYPFARGHQMQNAKALSDKGAAVLIEEKNLFPAALKDVLNLLQDRQLRERMSKASKEVAVPDAAKNLAQAVKDLIIR